jgi:hypothetical protein
MGLRRRPALHVGKPLQRVDVGIARHFGVLVRRRSDFQRSGPPRRRPLEYRERAPVKVVIRITPRSGLPDV